MENSWDPLVSGRDADEEIISAAQKRQIRNILKSYVGVYDSFCELIQNAMDAVERRAQEENEQYCPHLWITVNLRENKFSITDNGIGFKEKEFKSFLAPNISFKNGASGSRGNKGVGATYIAYGFEYLQFGTKGNGHEFIGEIKGGRNWVDDDAGVVTRPIVMQCESSDPYFYKVDRGATFTISYSGKNVRPKDLSWSGAITPDQWLYHFLIKTPLGSLNSPSERNREIYFTIKVIDKSGNETELVDQKAEYIYPHLRINASVDLKEVLGVQKRLLDAGKDVSKLPGKYFQSNGLYEIFSTEELKKLRSLDELSSILDEFKVTAYAYFVYSTSVWDQLSDVKAKLRKGLRILRGGLQLANNKMVQGDLIVIPLTSNTGYQNQCHVIVHFNGADPDLGRKGFQPELKEAAERISVAVVNRFKVWRHLLKADSGVQPEISKEIELHDWIKIQEQHELDSPLFLSNKNFFAPVNEISITSTPRSEQDVIVLFNQLLAGGVIRGMKLLATSQRNQYDGLFKFFLKEPMANHVFDKKTNPLGVMELHYASEFESPPKILEYKYNLDGLISEFENGEKNEKDIHLAVAWNIGELWKKNYTVTSLLDLDNLHHRPFHGLTHILHSANNKFFVIILSELIAYLNDVDKVQQHQRDAYGDNLF